MTDKVRLGDWLQVGTTKYYPLDPRANEIYISDIASALSKQCRFAGHCSEFYSVAEHSVYVSHLVPHEDALHGLLHDATEAYCIDVPRPLKKSLVGYAEIEEKNWLAVCERFGLSPEMPASVKLADNAMLLAERDHLIGFEVEPWNIPGEPADIVPWAYPPNIAYKMFMARFYELYDNQWEE